MSIIEINQQTCNKCGICAAECPLSLIVMEERAFPKPIERADADCMTCGHCVVVCPNGSLNHRDMPLEKTLELKDDLKVTPEQCSQLIRNRRSGRVFRDKPVSREVITRLIEDASYAPTGHNNQEVEWLVMDSKKDLEHIEELGTDWIEWVMKNLPQVAADLNMQGLLERQKLKHNVFLRGAPVLVVAHAVKDTRKPTITGIDSSVALGYLELAASSLGLGTCWAGFVYTMANTFSPIQAAIAVPEGHFTYGCMMLGYNKFKYRRIPNRKEPKIIWR
jgi:nitroreductase/Pyruvate/2-oxoacid:ferredoxin oxidoreductase delta subunit